MTLKIEYQHYKVLSDAIQRARSDCPAHTLESYTSRGLTPKRWRWDLMWYCSAKLLPKHWITETLYPYLNDNHIDSALKSITNTK